MSSKLGSLVNISQRKVSAALITLENYISTENMLPNCGGVTCVSSIPEGVQKIPGYEVGETLFSNIRTYFRKVWYADKDGTCSPDVLVFAAKDKNQINDHFLYYLLSNFDFIEYTDKTAKGAKMPRGDKDAIKNYEFECPSLRVQIKIANLLGSLDDRITLLRETNKTLEAIAQAMFKSWFIDFDPVRAKRQGRIPTGMNEETAALFPNELVESELGLIPKGWYCTDLVNACSYLNRGLSPKYVDAGGVLVLNQKCIRAFAVDHIKGRRHDPIQRKVDGRLLEVGDVLVNSTGVGTLGRVAQILGLNEPAIVDSHVTIVRANKSISWPYLGEYMKKMQPSIESMGEGSTGQTELSRSRLGGMKIVVPGNKALDVFDSIVKPLKQSIFANVEKSSKLAQLRDLLLPRLISGKLRIADAELEEHT